ncbi:MAG: hypothetical protein HC854_13385 [Flavobacterium sp.]|nr:hypothetical protein [Flavobacterium sp.]
MKLKNIQFDKLIFNENGDIMGEKEKYDTITDIINYKIDTKGLFLKVN